MLRYGPSHAPSLGGFHAPPVGLPVSDPSTATPSSQLRPGEAAIAPMTGAAPFAVAPDAHKQHTQYPYVTGTSVIGFKYADGIMIASDTLGSYGSTKRYKSLQRMEAVGEKTVLAASGEVSDFTYILTLLSELNTADFCRDDGETLSPKEIHAYLTRVMYNRRNKMDPLWNNLIIGGIERSGEAFLGVVGMIGQAYVDSHVATGFAAHLARPILREKHHDEMTEAEARTLMEDCLRVCYYRDKQSMNKFQIATVTAAGPSISEPFAIKTQWSYQAFHDPSYGVPGTW
mmetsp:Transcript_18685/g.60979  ORF Transcript_18685/g.60979 Transcript_18685/m.60979 type:complete len:287 (-) Transcript_18685:1647-2507(-)